MIKIHLDTQHLELDSELEDYLERRIQDIWFHYTKILSADPRLMTENKEAKANINHSGLEFTFDAWLFIKGDPENMISNMEALQSEINEPDWEYTTHKMLREEAKQDRLKSYEP